VRVVSRGLLFVGVRWCSLVFVGVARWCLLLWAAMAVVDEMNPVLLR